MAIKGGELAVVDVAEPEPRPGWVVISVSRCGICGSDLHFLHSPMAREGLVMGHEFSGRVETIGDGVTSLRPGDLVSALPAERCDSDAPDACGACRAGANQRCSRQAATSIGIAISGAFAERVEVPASSCVKLPERMPVESGALAEPLAVAIHGLRVSSFEPGMAVGVIGAGPIGALTVLAARVLGAGSIVVAERSPERAGLVEEIGADAVVSDAGAMRSAIGEAPSLIIECAGSVDTPAQAIAAVREGGEVVLVGVTDPQDSVRIPSIFWVLKEVSVRGAIAYTTDEYEEAVRLIADGTVDVGGVITDTRPLGAGPDAFRDLLESPAQLKILLAPGD